MRDCMTAYTDTLHYCFRSCLPWDRHKPLWLNPGTNQEARFLVPLAQNINYTILLLLLLLLLLATCPSQEGPPITFTCYTTETCKPYRNLTKQSLTSSTNHAFSKSRELATMATRVWLSHSRKGILLYRRTWRWWSNVLNYYYISFHFCKAPVQHVIFAGYNFKGWSLLHACNCPVTVFHTYNVQLCLWSM